jgi:uncharacterized protein YndB with AHSA1/START domain
MKDEFRTTFTVEVGPEEVWPAVARNPADHRRSAVDSPPGTQVWLPGWEMTGEVLEVTPGQTLRLRKDEQPCKGTEILITLEHEGSGTKVTLVQSGFGAFFEAALKVLSVGADFIFRDFALYLETGVSAHRHFSVWGPSLGADTKETASGLMVERVTPDSLAARAGLQPGDRLLTVAGASIADMRDLVIALRTQQGVQSVELAWVRGREPMQGKGSL